MKKVTLSVGDYKIDLTGKKDVYGEIYNILQTMYLTEEDEENMSDTPIFKYVGEDYEESGAASFSAVVNDMLKRGQEIIWEEL